MGSLWSWWALWAGATLLWARLSPAEASCQGIQCTSGQRCQMVSGKARCVAESTAVCRAQGDPHYTTFDGRRYDMMGTCSYTMAELSGEDETLPAFSVEAKNEHRGSRQVSYVGLVTVYAYSHSVSLVRGETGFARIDNQRSRLPASLSDGRLRVYQSGTRGVIELDFELVVTYDWDCQLTLSLPKRFQNQVWGLCGNYNGDPADDFLTPDGEQAPDALEFANSWKLDDGDYLCDDGCHTTCPSCTAGQTQHYKGDRLCGMLTLSTGPFSACHEFLDPKPFLEDCVFDLCVTGGERLSLCRSLSAYAQACAELGVSLGNWRSPSNCPMSCPANSCYDPCSPACPASCNSEAAPANCSERPCVEGCVCLPGFVASGGDCVPVSSCGCTFQGRPLAPGQEVFADDLCRQRCTCDAATQKVICRDTSGCPSGERCRVLNGLLGCYPDNFASCQASGDPHYVSFDGRRFDFMGTCAYLLVGSCGQDAALPDFKVLVENEHRGSQTVSYTRAVRVVARGVEVAVRRRHPGRVLVDGVLQYLPFQAAGGQVQVFRQGNDAVVRTDFGLTVTYNWDARVTAKVPSSYAKAVCGLCGNFNGDPSDDLALRGGGQATSALDFGNSWQEEVIPGCSATDPGDCPQLDSLVTQQQQSKKECGILADPEGPFRECHKLLDPQGALRDCVYDLCLLPGQPKPLCDALAAYAAACQAAGGTVHPWRSETLCPLACPPHSHYEPCSYGCPLSCGDLPVSQGCGTECRESCVCDEGYALSGESCVPLASCGCVHQGTYHPPGETFYPGPGCDSLCHCQEGGLVSCEPSSCGPHEACQPSNGVLGCVAVGTTTCQASGDPHYITFDGRRFDFMGTCVYVLAQTCGTRPGLHEFTVLQENEAWGNGQVSVTKAITVLVANHTLRLEQNQWKVTVDGETVVLPVTKGHVSVTAEGRNMVLQTSKGLKLLFDGDAHILMSIPSPFRGRICGLCGNFNGNWSDDFVLPDGTVAPSAEAFGAEWRAPSSSLGCGEGCGPQGCPVCLAEETKSYEKNEACGKIRDPQGPFKDCHQVLSPLEYFRQCVYDLCAHKGNKTYLCRSLAAYTAACQAAGATVKPWRTDSFCPLQCPDHSHYSVCMSSCQGSCAALSGLTQCTTRCFEGCECDNHYLLSQGVCIPAHDCGCTYNGQYMPVNCSELCCCSSRTGLTCHAAGCPSGQVCELQGGVRKCQPASCQGIQCTSGQRCQMVSGKARCVAESTAVCRAQGDPHYTTFDGRRYDMMGTCSYTMAELHSTKKSLLAFKVEAKNEHRGTNKVSYVRFVTVRAYNHTVSLAYGEIGIAQVSSPGLPASLSDGRLRVYQSGTQGVVELDFGLVVTYDWDCQLTLSLPKRFQDQVSGLCGNYNGDPADDFRMPDGKQASDVLNFTKSWKLDNGDLLCDDGCFGNCPSCTTSQTQFFKGDCLCGILTLSTGPFADCHDFLDPKPFLEECVYDMCVTRGERLTLCHGLSAYARACADLGISVREWRSRTNCSMSCPANSYYDLCSPACPASCNSEAAPANCSRRPCVEGCVCLPGFVSNRGLCVPVSSCGCTFQGRLLAPGQEVFADDLCRQRCTCDAATQKVICRDTSGCLSGERCGIQNGFLGCYPEYFGSCRASGDPHYMTFDRRNYNFMGTCTYMLTTSCGQHPSLPDFKVIMENERRGSQSVSFVHSVQLEVYGVKLEVPRNYPGKLDGVIRYLPFQAAGGKIVAFRRGMYAVLRTNFGLTLSFNWDTHVTAKVPSSYAKAVCGLCGNFNGEPRDDLGQQDKGEALDPRDFGKKWMVTEKPGCRTDEQLRCPHMNSKSVVKNKEKCKILRDKEGQFRHCWKVPMFNSALIECAYDSCRMPGQTKPLCDALATYTAICQAEGITHPFLTCPANSHYQLCGDSCPVSCPSLLPPEGCETTCREGCVCDSGFVLSGDTCVPVGQCGCLHNGRYYLLGATFYPGPECERLCGCGPGGQVSCQIESCGIHEECQIVDGIHACHPKSFKSVLVLNGIHYVTLDGRVYDLYGSCSYVLAQVCYPKPGLKEFSIVLEKNLAGEPQRVVVTVDGQDVVLAKGPQVTVESEAVTLPVVIGSMYVTVEGRNMFLQTKWGLKLLFDGDAHILMVIPSPFYGRICGLCGNFNGNQSDDFVLPSGTLAPNVEAFGAAWRAPGSSLGCGEGCGPQGCPVCLAEKREAYEKNEACGQISNPQGPFKDCHQVLSPLEYFRQCVFNMCAHKRKQVYLCRSLAAYTAACQAVGATVKPWRTDSFCPLRCPDHSHYSVCMSSCQGSCAALSGLTQCTTRCFEGCECDNHYLLSQGVCIPAHDCGCTYNGQYMPVNTSRMTSDCTKRCSCSTRTGLTCRAAGCPSGHVCEIRAGVRDCWPAKGLCSISVEANLTTFDGARNAISSPGVYELSSRCPGLQKTVPWYRVVADVQPRHGNDKVIGKVHVFFKNGMVTVTQSKGVWVNGLRVDPPANVLTSVSVSKMPDGSMLIHQKAGVQVRLGINGQLDVMVGDDHAALLCGACGNFDGDQKNDVHKYQGKTLMDKWKAQDFSSW
uniref:Mucin-2 n=1 Tax=Peromyscus maniculatus bairdii TaxID=230844 RepID=A0A8C8TMN1_PERMB